MNWLLQICAVVEWRSLSGELAQWVDQWQVVTELLSYLLVCVWFSINLLALRFRGLGGWGQWYWGQLDLLQLFGVWSAKRNVWWSSLVGWLYLFCLSSFSYLFYLSNFFYLLCWLRFSHLSYLLDLFCLFCLLWFLGGRNLMLRVNFDFVPRGNFMNFRYFDNITSPNIIDFFHTSLILNVSFCLLTTTNSAF